MHLKVFSEGHIKSVTKATSRKPHAIYHITGQKMKNSYLTQFVFSTYHCQQYFYSILISLKHLCFFNELDWMFVINSEKCHGRFSSRKPQSDFAPKLCEYSCKWYAIGTQYSQGQYLQAETNALSLYW